MTPASSNSTPAAVPSATVPLACSCDQLQRAQQRLQALASQCGERVDRLQQAFDQLPAAVSFDPFAVAASAPIAGATTAAAPAPRSKGQARSAADGSWRAPALPAPRDRVDAAGRQPGKATQATADDGGPGIAGAWAGAAGGGSGAASGTVAAPASPRAGGVHQQADAGPASLNGWLGSLGDLAALGGEQVALLMRRHAAPSLAVGLGGAVAAALAGQGEQHAQPTVAQRHRDAGGLLGASSGSALRAAMPAHESSAPQRPSTVLGQGLNAAFADVGWPEAQTMPARRGGAAPQALATAPQLLEHLLAQGLGNAVAGTLGLAAQPAKPARQPAPRAASRLVGAQPGTADNQARAQVPDAPAAALLDALDAGEAMAQQISRLLLDQAWMRGVDLR